MSILKYCKPVYLGLPDPFGHLPLNVPARAIAVANAEHERLAEYTRFPLNATSNRVLSSTVSAMCVHTYLILNSYNIELFKWL